MSEFAKKYATNHVNDTDGVTTQKAIQEMERMTFKTRQEKRQLFINLFIQSQDGTFEVKNEVKVLIATYMEHIKNPPPPVEPTFIRFFGGHPHNDDFVSQDDDCYIPSSNDSSNQTCNY
jgi:hypothetical protein